MKYFPGYSTKTDYKIINKIIRLLGLGYLIIYINSTLNESDLTGGVVLLIPDEILKPFNAVMEQKALPRQLQSDYRKWLRYYLAFRIKYPPPDSRSDHVRLFTEKLRSKNQTRQQLELAADTLSLFFEMQREGKTESGERGNAVNESVHETPLPSVFPDTAGDPDPAWS